MSGGGNWGYDGGRREDRRDNYRDEGGSDNNWRRDRNSYQRSDRGGYDRPERQNTYGSGAHSASLGISSNQVGKLIGRGGSNIRDIQSKFSVNVNVGKDQNSHGEKTVAVSGNKQSDVDEAVSYIRDQLENSKPYGEERHWNSAA